MPVSLIPLLILSYAGLLYIHGANLAWEPANGCRRAKLPMPASGRPGFTQMADAESNLQFTNVLAQARALANLNLLNGSGVALGDYDGDGLCDVYLCSLDTPNVLFKNLGNWKFKPVTAEAGVACPGQASTGAVFADVNGDGKLDLLVSAMGGPNACFINLGHGKFTNTTAAAGISSNLGGMSMALGDVDGNGTLDLYLANYGVTSILRSGGALNVSYVNGQPVVRGRYAQRIKIVNGIMYELGEPDALYLNDGAGRFKKASWTDGTFLDAGGKPLSESEIPWDQGLSVIFRDLNGDRAPDIYVCNDAFTPDRCWINDGKGRFRAMHPLALRTTSYFSMGIDFGDLDRDSHDDFFVVDMLSRRHDYVLTQKGTMSPQPRIPGDLLTRIQVRRNTLFRGRGDATFAEIANFAGVAGSEWSWSGVFIDVDLDGWEDILVSNGFPFNVDDMDMQRQTKGVSKMTIEQSRRSVLLYPPLATPNIAFHNQRNMTFTETGQSWGFNATNISNGMALADLDNDGDLDAVVNCLNSHALAYRNDSAAPRIAVRLKGKSPNTQGIGAKIKVDGGPVTQTQEVMSGGRYVSGDDPLRVFACGVATRLKIEVTWRNGLVSVVEGAEPNCIYEIDEQSSRPAPATPAPIQAPVFTDASALLQHRHQENSFDDFQVQSSLPSRLSQMGPAAAWADLDGDGFDDLVIGSSKGAEITGFRNDTKGGFEPLKSLFPGKDETSGLLFWRKGDSETELLAGINNLESRSTNDLVAYRVNARSFAEKPAAFPGTGVTGPLALTELNGRITLFVGGRFVPGRYPEPANSFIFRHKDGVWTRDENLSQSLVGAGLVSGATWSDLDADGAAELVLACEWGSIRIFKAEGIKLVERTREWGLAAHIGRWLSVSAGDFDADGQMDLIAGNWGRNSAYEQTADHQIQMFYGDISGGGGVEMMEAYVGRGTQKTVPWRDLQILAQSFPFLKEKFPTHKQFAQASIEEVLSGRMGRVKSIKTSALDTMIFLNKTGKFEPRRLPPEAQYAPVFGISVADFNGDGNEDAFLAQNFFAVREDESRLDAGRGLLLLGRGDGELTAVSGQQSGIAAYGEQRATAVADFDHDGRPDLLVTQNATDTKLYRNVTGNPGLRVHLNGGPLNPSGFGALVRLKFGESWGPAREFRCGSGYWSQDSMTHVMATPQPPTHVQVSWPGGRETITLLPSNPQEVIVNSEGAISVSK